MKKTYSKSVPYRIIVLSLTTFYNIGDKPQLHY